MRPFMFYVRAVLTDMHPEKFVEGLSLDKFARHIKTLYAVVRRIEIIGEAPKNIPKWLRKQYPEAPWKEMAGMRDKVIHFYFGVVPAKVWLAVKERVPKVKGRFERETVQVA